MVKAASEIRIVVGVDGSTASVSALKEGARLADELGGVVEAVAVWEMPTKHSSYAALGIGSFEEGAQKVLSDALFQAFGEQVPTTISAHLIKGQAAGALTTFSEGARMLVIGRRGQGGLMSLLLGSVSGALVNQATVPVLVVP
ncbi:MULTISPECIES: universal stress protein [Arthrobacter]|uniref:universal stress protein n=1 Tax=unclassified Arthrobacter TaxID=235627 RepID=UPI0024BA57CE|nr:universal stress protein [Arthrobacter sp. H35-MC1]MDJ0315638.1 universal stress protein [Arthrobacter sp. H35-MC1]